MHPIAAVALLAIVVYYACSFFSILSLCVAVAVGWIALCAIGAAILNHIEYKCVRTVGPFIDVKDV